MNSIDIILYDLYCILCYLLGSPSITIVSFIYILIIVLCIVLLLYFMIYTEYFVI